MAYFTRVTDSITETVPYVSDTTFQLPFGMDLLGRHKLSDDCSIPHDAKHAHPKLSARTAAYFGVLSRCLSGEFSACPVSLIGLVGTFAAAVNPAIKTMEIVKPIVLEAKEAFSLLYLFSGIQKFNFIREAVFVYNVLGGMARDTSAIITALRRHREFRAYIGATSTQPLKYLETVVQ